MASVQDAVVDPTIPYFNNLLTRLENDDPEATKAFGRHVHWGYWDNPDEADGTPENYARAAEHMCRMVTDAAGISDGMRVLDVGCGFGGTIASLNERFRGLELVGLNIDCRQLARAEKTIRPRNGNRIRWVQGNACALPFVPGSFDVALAVECIFHFPDRELFFREAHRVLRPTGKLTVSDIVPTDEALPVMRGNAERFDANMKATYGHIDLYWPASAYREMGSATRLPMIDEQDITEQTLPTYPFLRAYYRRDTTGHDMRPLERATAHLEVASRMGWLRYAIFTFARQAGGEG